MQPCEVVGLGSNSKQLTDWSFDRRISEDKNQDVTTKSVLKLNAPGEALKVDEVIECDW
jgi:hypothetical protein